MFAKAQTLALAGVASLLIFSVSACGESPDTPPSDVVDCYSTADCEEPAVEGPEGQETDEAEPEGGYTEIPPSPDIDYWTDPPRSNCAFAGDIACPDTPITIPPPDLSPWS